MSYHSYTGTEKLMGCEELHKKTKGEVFIIMGFQRSGTSLLANIAKTCGVFFGNQKELKGPLITNPKGFFEHKLVSLLSWKYLSQAGYTGNIDYNVNLHTKNFWQAVRRLFTVRHMHRVLYKLSAQSKKWGLKNFPLFYYIWKDYLPKHKIIAIYRDPYVATHSFLNIFWPAKFTYEYGLSLWVQAQKDLIYHTSQTESILVRYEDLIDNKTNTEVIEKIIAFIGSGNVQDVKAVIDASLNRKKNETSQLNYPACKEVDRILETLNTLKSNG